MSTNPLQVKVQICVQFFKVGEIDTLKEQFTADVVVKAKWREPTLDGQNKTASILAFVNFNLHLYVYNIFLIYHLYRMGTIRISNISIRNLDWQFT